MLNKFCAKFSCTFLSCLLWISKAMPCSLLPCQRISFPLQCRQAAVRCTSTAAQGRVTSPWCRGVTRGGGFPWANTQSGGRPSPAAAAGSRDRVLTPRRPPGGAVCEGSPGLPVAQPTPGLAIAPPPPPQAHTHRVFLHRCIMGWGPSAATWGPPWPPWCPVGPGVRRLWNKGRSPGRDTARRNV